MTGDSELNQVAVIGAGTMGAGIAQVCAMAGHGISVCDPAPQQLQRARKEIAASLAKLASKGQLAGTTPDDVLGRVRCVPSVGACAEGADVVIESVVENLEVKGSVLCEALEVARPDALLAPIPPSCRSPPSRRPPVRRPTALWDCTSSIPPC